MLDVDDVARMVADAIERNQLYIVTHPESRRFVQRRFQRIDEAFEGL